MFDLDLQYFMEYRKMRGSHYERVSDLYVEKLKARNKDVVKYVMKNCSNKASDMKLNDETSEKRKKRKMGTAGSEDHQPNEHKKTKGKSYKSSLFGIDCSPNEEDVKKRRIPPEETFEYWYQEPDLNRNVSRNVTSSRVKYDEPKEEEATDGEETEQKTGQDEQQEGEMFKKGRLTFLQENSRSVLTSELYVRKNGLELLPKVTVDRNHILAMRGPGVLSRHQITLYELLFQNIFKRKWRLAYRCFTMMIRLDDVDLRGLWHLGIEILQRLTEEEAQRKYPDLSPYDLNSQNFLQMDKQQQQQQRRSDFDFEEGEFSSRDNPFINKDNQLHEWYAVNYPSFKMLGSVKIFWTFPVPQRFGTKETSPLHVRHQIWNLIMQRKFDLVDEKLGSLLLVPPYAKDGMFHYLQGVSYQYRASLLSEDYVSAGMNSEEIEKLIADAKKCFSAALECGFVIPEDLLEGEYSILKSRLYDLNSKYDSEPEYVNSEDLVDSSDAEQRGETGNSAMDSFTGLSNDMFEDEFERFEKNLGSTKRNRNPDSEDEYEEEDVWDQQHRRYRNADSDDE
ncbi:hypothetical protein WICPIJ_001604 [Wickerhamomyces pijperi]|uniref:Uncharacterized protein n=1 Tax=Wickerhamomyces pijperi TaxID=599730 RepID=A0A9P8QBB6_WICPI|nr:hypothetical protein WICPIJ_001604 [Wickerhamomyces pijperi]